MARYATNHRWCQLTFPVGYGPVVKIVGQKVRNELALPLASRSMYTWGGTTTRMPNVSGTSSRFARSRLNVRNERLPSAYAVPTPEMMNSSAILQRDMKKLNSSSSWLVSEFFRCQPHSATKGMTEWNKTRSRMAITRSQSRSWRRELLVVALMVSLAVRSSRSRRSLPGWKHYREGSECPGIGDERDYAGTKIRATAR